MGATSDLLVAPFVSSYTEVSLNCLFQCPPFFLEPMEYSFATEMETVVDVIGRVLFDLYLYISDTHIFFSAVRPPIYVCL